MSRILKFRAWDKKAKRMLLDVDPFAIHVSGSNQPLLASGSDNADCIFEQFTGLKDKNGTEIYEGDILIFRLNDKDCFLEIRWHQEECCFEAHFYKGHFGDSLLADDAAKEYEVIGTIHDKENIYG